MAQDPNQNRPADVAQADSVGGMAKRLLNPAHLSDLARRSAATLKEQGAEQLWRDVTFRVGLAFHHDSWQHRADLPLRRELKAQRAEYADGKPGPVVSVVVPLYNTPEKFFGQMLASVQKQTYPHWQLVLVDASDAAHAAFSTHAARPRQRIRASCIRKWKTAALRPIPRQALRWQRGRISPCWTMTMCCTPTRCMRA